MIKMGFFFFLHFLVIQTEGWISFGLPCNLGMQLPEVLNYRVSNFLFELPWKYSQFGLQLGLEFLLGKQEMFSCIKIYLV